MATYVQFMYVHTRIITKKCISTFSDNLSIAMIGSHLWYLCSLYNAVLSVFTCIWLISVLSVFTSITCIWLISVLSIFTCIWLITVLSVFTCIWLTSVLFAYSAGGNRSQTHECGNWGWGRAIPRKGIHKWDFRCSAWVFFSVLTCIWLMSWTMELVLVLSSLLSHSTLVSLKSSISASESDFTEVWWSSLNIKKPNNYQK